MSEHMKIKMLPESERPYEKYALVGAEGLSDAELLSVIIKNGTKSQSSLDIARRLLCGYQGNLLNLYDYTYEELCQLPGIGKVKALQLKAIAELSMRIAKTKRGYDMKMGDAYSIAHYYMEQMRHLQREHLVCALFDAQFHFLGDVIISEGSTNYAYFSPKDILRCVLQKNACSFVLLHNHPSGNASPSRDDRMVTKRIYECAQLLEVHFADHIIIGDNEYYSFLEHEDLT